jgi:hypothetical protein
MTSDLQQGESSNYRQTAPEGTGQQMPAPGKRAALEVEIPGRAGLRTSERRGARHLAAGLPVDLVQEGANMQELGLRQTRCATLLSISSKATQALLRQF